MYEPMHHRSRLACLRREPEASRRRASASISSLPALTCTKTSTSAPFQAQQSRGADSDRPTIPEQHAVRSL